MISCSPIPSLPYPPLPPPLPIIEEWPSIDFGD